MIVIDRDIEYSLNFSLNFSTIFRIFHPYPALKSKSRALTSPCVGNRLVLGA